MWGVIDVLVDPYTGSKEGNVRVVCHADCDIGALRGERFSDQAYGDDVNASAVCSGRHLNR